jgi:hypothetical protein
VQIPAVLSKIWTFTTTRCWISPAADTRFGHFSQTFLLLPMNSHVIPVSTVNGHDEAGAAQDPEQAKKGSYIQANPFTELRDPARERAEHLPQVARVAGRPAMGQAADRAVAAARSAVIIFGPRNGAAAKN